MQNLAIAENGQAKEGAQLEAAAYACEGSFAEVLGALARLGYTGQLDVRAPTVLTRLYFVEGRPVFAELGLPEHAFGQLLLQTRRISQQQYTRVVREMTDKLVDHEEMRMGDYLVLLGVLTPSDVYETLKQQLHERLLSCFRWTSCEYTLVPEVRVGSESQFEARPLEQLILEGICRYYDAVRLDRLLALHSEHYPRVFPGAEQQCSAFAFDCAERKLALSLDGQRSLAQVGCESALARGRLVRVVALLYLGGTLRFRTRRGGDQEKGSGKRSHRRTAKLAAEGRSTDGTAKGSKVSLRRRITRRLTESWVGPLRSLYPPRRPASSRNKRAA